MASSILLSDNGVSSGSAGLKSSAGNDGTLLLQTTTAGGAATTAILVDNAQNVGLGVTPSAWSGPFKAIQSGNGGSAVGFQTNANVMRLFVNNFYNGTNYVYTGSAAASQYTCNSDGSFNWQIAASGTAGNAISFTQAMTLDASGTLLVGRTSSPSVAGAKVAISSSGDAAYQLTKDGVVSARVMAVTTGLAFGVDLADGSTERARIDSSGNLLVGTTSALGGGISGFSLNGNNIGITLGQSGTNKGYFWYSAGSSRLNVESASGTTIACFSGGTGGVSLANGATSWAAVSDETLKTPVQPFTNAAEKINSLRAGTGRYLTDEETVSRSFLIAQDVQKVLPEAVVADTDGTLMLQYQDLIPLLTAAIQEQQAIIQTLTQRVEALEGAK